MTPPAPGVPGAGEPTPGAQPRPGPDDAPRAASDAGPVGCEGVPFWGPAASWLLFRALWPTRVHDVQLVPDRGPVLFESNHTGFLDGPMLGSLPRRLPGDAADRRVDVGVGEAATAARRRLRGADDVDRAGGGVPGRVALAEASATLRDTMAVHVMRAQTRTGQFLPEDLGWTPDEIARGEHL